MIKYGFNAFGASDVFQEIQADIPEPKPDQVQIKVMAFGLNPYDLSLLHGANGADAKFPIVPGTEVAGVVTALGSDVTDLRIGDHVMNYRPRGGYSEYVTATRKKVGRLDNDTPFTIGAALPQVGIAAYSAVKLFNLKPGRTIAIEGASGGVGSIVLQIAKFQGLKIIAISHSRNHDLLMKLGADTAGHYDLENVGAEFANQADYVFNGTTNGDDDGAGAWMLRDGGTYVSLNALPETMKDNPNYHVVGEAGAPDVQQAFAFLQTLRMQADLWINIDKVFPMSLTGVQQAVAELETHHKAGKIVCSREETKLVRPSL
ncbi:NADP-dependent oxidoreductase [Lacticaseibacillus pabuli]|uniref:NADP-dependent oxidoreductase n=1 Tax=Lacticaseibacillus pabuli TaxID=3025672 RepID=A0ABY7WUS6_9LACO|nr:NADP-dependent oxidoreductase [Lacticaseibacillus sp. KACC 23028]WDF83546.1 NADP-dependent oxidoreductase [Lacticaseibacillus sp. KACC 23028]